MTKRINWRLWQELTREQRTDPRHHIPGDEVEEILAFFPPLYPIMLTDLDTRCVACDRLIERGHTIFACQTWPMLAPVLCYTCGIGWEMYQGRLTFEQAVEIPPIGGPRS